MSEQETGETYISLPQAAQLLETTETRVLMMLKRKELWGKLEDDAWLVEKKSLQACAPSSPTDGISHCCGGGCGGCGEE
jgi:hypothetical protein